MVRQRNRDLAGSVVGVHAAEFRGRTGLEQTGGHDFGQSDRDLLLHQAFDLSPGPVCLDLVLSTGRIVPDSGDHAGGC